ncbi:MAG: Trm112 family protein [Alphaproteobacteria bacterium]|nr:Trm112 family protein [Alphaproteobacteria bacterium]
MNTGGMPLVNPHMLVLLVCPLTRGAVVYDAERHELISPQAGLAYPVREGVPIMLVEEARRTSEGEF